MKPSDAKILFDSRHRYTLLEFVELIFGAWVEKHLVPAVNQNLDVLFQASRRKRPPHYGPVTTDDMMRYLLKRFVQGLQKHRKHNIPASTLLAAEDGLLGTHRFEVINAHVGFGTHVMQSLCDTFTKELLPYVQLGSTCAADETIMPSYSRKADERNLLVFVEGKPYDYGLEAYVLCQRLRLTRLRIGIALQPKFTFPIPTPTDAVVRMLQRVRDHGGERAPRLHCVLDSLWGKAASFEEFHDRGMLVTAVVTSNNGIVPDSLLSRVSSDLPLRQTRTLVKGSWVLQAHGGSKRVTTLVSNAWAVPAAPPPDHAWTYSEAVGFLTKFTASRFARAFKLSGQQSLLPLPHMIKLATDWDPLRLESEQGSEQSLTIEAAQKMTPAQIWWIHYFAFPNINQTQRNRLSKEKQIAELFPDAARAAHGRGRKGRKRAVAEIISLQESTVGPPSETKNVYDSWNRNFDSIDRMNEEYHNHFQLHGTKDAMGWATQSLVHYFFATVRSLWEEFVVTTDWELHNEDYSRIFNHKPKPFPEFVVQVCTEYTKKYGRRN